MYRINLYHCLVAAAAGLVVMLGVISSSGALPITNDESDLSSNTGGGYSALESNTTGSGNTAYGAFALQQQHHRPATTPLMGTLRSLTTAPAIKIPQTVTYRLGSTPPAATTPPAAPRHS